MIWLRVALKGPGREDAERLKFDTGYEHKTQEVNMMNSRAVRAERAALSFRHSQQWVSFFVNKVNQLREQ